MPLRPRISARGRRGGFWRHWTLWIYFPLAMLLILGGVCLWKSGRWLVAEDRFDKASWAVILAGEGRDAERTDAALKLYLEGRIDSLIYSSTRMLKNRYASEFMVDYLAKEGYPSEKLNEFRHDAYSTQEEAALLIRQFRQQNLDTVVIITVNFHTARTRRIFRKLAQGYPHILVYPAEFKDFVPAAWWSSREGRKWWLLEWAKTVSTFFELMNAPAETGKAEVNALVNHARGPATVSAGSLSTPTLTDSLATAALDSAAGADSLAGLAKDSISGSPAAHPSASGDSSQSADTTEKTGQASPEKSDRATTASQEDQRRLASGSKGESDGKSAGDSLVKPVPSSKDSTPRTVTLKTASSKTPTSAKTSSPVKSTSPAKTTKSESSKSSAKKTPEKSTEKSSSKSTEKEKKKSTR